MNSTTDDACTPWTHILKLRIVDYPECQSIWMGTKGHFYNIVCLSPIETHRQPGIGTKISIESSEKRCGSGKAQKKP
jgi:hypothetical protein